jgi:hypothetical protein
MFTKILQTRKNRTARRRRRDRSRPQSHRRVSLEALENRELMCVGLATSELPPTEPESAHNDWVIIQTMSAPIVRESAECDGLEGELVQTELAEPETPVVHAESAGDFQTEMVAMTLEGDRADSFFDVFVEVDLPGLSGEDGPMPQSTQDAACGDSIVQYEWDLSGPARLRAIEDVFARMGSFQAEIVEMTLMGDLAGHPNGDGGSKYPVRIRDFYIDEAASAADPPSDGGGLQPDGEIIDDWYDIDDWLEYLY